MPDEIYGVMAVKNGQKQTIMNLSNARQKSYADLQTMTDAQKKGVIVCPDYPTEEFLVTADEVSYGGGTVKDALDKMPFHTMSVAIAGTVISSYYAQIATGLDTTKYRAIGLSEGSNYDEKCNFSIRENGGYIIVKCISSSYTISANARDLTLIYVDKDLFV